MAAATHDYIVGGTGGVKALSPGMKLLYKVIDLDTAATSFKTNDVFEANDVIQCLQVPAHAWVIGAGVTPTTADGAVLTGDLGDGADPDGYVDGIDLNATTTSAAPIATGYGAGTMLGKFYDAADTIDLTIATIGAQTEHAGVLTVWAVVIEIPTS